MSKKDAFEVGAKLLGLYLLVISVRSFAHFAETVGSRILPEVLQVSTLVLTLGLAWVLLFKTSALVSRLPWDPSEPAGATDATPSSGARLSSWIALLGLYYFMRSVDRLVSTLVLMLWYGGAGDWEQVLLPLVALGLSLVLVLRCNQIERYIVAKSDSTAVAVE